jgi:hypothetical protein
MIRRCSGHFFAATNNSDFQTQPIDSNPILDGLLLQLCHHQGTDEFFKNSKSIRKDIASRLIQKFEILKIPVENNLNVISLGCGVPDDFLAIQAYLKSRNPTAKCTYFGIDIDSTDNELNKIQFANFTNMQILTGDATDKTFIQNALINHPDILAQGFDLIFLRHPDITSAMIGSQFIRMLADFIPYIAAETSLLLTTTYHRNEMNKVGEILNATQYYEPVKNNFIEFLPTFLIEFADGTLLPPDCFTLLFCCKGQVFNMQAHQKLLAEISKVCPEKIMAALNKRNYSFALRLASSELHLLSVKLILKYKDHLNIDVNIPSNNKNTALDWAAKAKGSETIRQTIIEMLTTNGCQYATQMQPTTHVSKRM